MRAYLMSVHLIVSFVVRQERLASFRTLLDGVKRDLPNVPGCVAVRVFNESDRQHIFVVVEHWQSQEHHRAHLERLVQLRQLGAHLLPSRSSAGQHLLHGDVSR